MADSVDSLQIEVNASAKKANTQLDTLITKLDTLSSSLSSLNTSGLTALAGGVTQLGSAMASLKGSTNSKDFTLLAKNLEKIANVNVSGFNTVATSLKDVAYGIRGISSSVGGLSSFANAVKQLGYKGTSTAIANLPQLTTAIKNMMTSLSTAPEVSNNVIKMTNALANLAKQSTKVGTATKSLNKALDSTNTTSVKTVSVVDRLRNNLNSLSATTSKAKTHSSGLASSIGLLYAKFWMIYRAIKAIGSAAESTMDYIEAFNFFDVAITSATANTNEWAELGYNNSEEYAQAFEQHFADLNEKMSGFKVDVKTGDIDVSSMTNLGLNLTQLTTFQSEIISLTSSLGLCTQTSSDVATALSMLTADMSSLHNIDLDTVMTNFQSGLIGQSRALYKYGIDITNANLQTYAYANGVSKAVSEMTQAEKMQLRMLAMLDLSRNAWGDLANTLDQPANQFRVLKNGIANLAVTIGKVLMPVVSAVLPYLNAMVKALQTFFTWLAKAFGANLDVKSGATGTSDTLEGLEDSADDATDSVNGTTKAVEDLAKATLGIDELNIISPDTDSSSNSGTSGSAVGSGTVDLSQEISDILAEYQEVWDEAYDKTIDNASRIVSTLIKCFEHGDYGKAGTYISDGLTGALESIPWDSVYSVSSGFASGFAEFLNGLITPDVFSAVGQTIAGSLNTAIYTALSFGETFDFKNLGNSIASGINTFFTTFDFNALARTINVWTSGLRTTFLTALNNIDWKDVVYGVFDFLDELKFSTVATILGVHWLWGGGAKALAKTALESLIGTDVKPSVALSSVAIAGILGWEFGQLLSKTKIVSDLTDKLVEWLYDGDDTLNIGKAISVTLGSVVIAIGAASLAPSALSTLKKAFSSKAVGTVVTDGVAEAASTATISSTAKGGWIKYAKGVGALLALQIASILGEAIAGALDEATAKVEQDMQNMQTSWDDVENLTSWDDSQLKKDLIAQGATQEELAQKQANYLDDLASKAGLVNQQIAHDSTAVTEEQIANLEKYNNALKESVASSGTTLDEFDTMVAYHMEVYGLTQQQACASVETTYGFYKTTTGEIVGATQEELNTLRDNIEDFGLTVTSSTEKTTASVGSTVSLLHTDTSTWFDKIKNSITTSMAESNTNATLSASNLKDSILSKFNSTETSSSNIFDKIKDTVSKSMSNSKGIIDEQNWASSGINLVDGLKNGITSKWNASGGLFSEVKGLASKLTAKLKEAFDIHSPSRIWNKEIGQFLPLGLMAGIDTTTPEVLSGVKAFGESVTSSLSSSISVPTVATDLVPDTGEVFATTERQFTTSLNANVGTNMQTVVEEIKDGVTEAVASVLEPYLRQIADNTKETADKDLSVNIGDRDIAKANTRGQRSMGAVLRTT